MESINWVALICGLAGGLGLFLYGMKLMSEGLQKSAGDRLRLILEKLTANRVIGAVVGMVITAIIQSSSATTVMVVGFVNAGLMNLSQALSVVLGANVGTTITAQLIAFKVGELALPAIGTGVFLKMFSKDKKVQYYSEVILGFGMLFLGLTIMKDTFVPLRQSTLFHETFVNFSTNPVLAVIAGTLLTMIVQSSSATIGITIVLATTGLIDFPAAAALVLGENIGTTITANLAAIGTNLTARRAALGHLLFNLIGVIYMLIFLKFFTHIVDAITPGDAYLLNSDGVNPFIARHIANFHTLFNIINLIVFLPILHLLAIVCKKIIKGTDKKRYGLKYIDDRFISTPSMAVVQAKKEVERMSAIAIGMLKLSKNAFYKRDIEIVNTIYEMEINIDHLEKDILDYLVKLFQQPLGDQSSGEIKDMMQVLHDLEKIGDYAENIASYIEKSIDNQLLFSEAAEAELNIIFDVAIRFSEYVIGEYNKGHFPRPVDTEDENLIDSLRGKYKDNHLSRLNNGICTTGAAIMYADILNNLEKTGDQVFNIAQIINGTAK
ncbi:MAG: Na/Pi cotransporter family protein [Proteobacteria bacterium]|nr:Na/Pi cotransporter family protein [Pseudomonadota bacterium]